MSVDAGDEAANRTLSGIERFARFILRNNPDIGYGVHKIAEPSNDSKRPVRPAELQPESNTPSLDDVVQVKMPSVEQATHVKAELQKQGVPSSSIVQEGDSLLIWKRQLDRQLDDAFKAELAKSAQILDGITKSVKNLTDGTELPDDSVDIGSVQEKHEQFDDVEVALDIEHDRDTTENVLEAEQAESEQLMEDEYAARATLKERGQAAAEVSELMSASAEDLALSVSRSVMER